MKIIITCIFLIYLYGQVAFFRVRNLKIKDKKINSSIKILQISDFHDNRLINLKKLEREINKFNPDLVFLTGDIISRDTNKFIRIEKFFGIFKEYRTFFVDGNHEVDNKNKEYYKYLKDNNIKNISKNFDRIVLNGNIINIYGNGFGKNSIIEANLDLREYNILLSHSPDSFLSKPYEYDFVFSGHKHGGQVRIPFIGQVIDHGPKFFPKYSKGLYKVNNSKLYIDSGLGQSIYLRFMNPVSYSQFIIY